MIKVNYKKLKEKAVEPFKTYPEDFCFDVVATSKEEIFPNIYKYGIGLCFEIDRDELDKYIDTVFHHEIPLSLDFRPRSSIWKTGLILANGQGTVDELYRGEVCAIFYKVNEYGEPYNVGDKIAQCKLGITLPIYFKEVTELSETNRGNKGFGSTGK